MKNTYYNEMVHMLLAHPDGMRLGHIVRTIYNSNCDLFCANARRLYDDIYQSTLRYLWRQSRLKQSPFERKRWGVYGLRRNFVVQLEFCFDEWEDEVPKAGTQASDTHRGEASAYMRDLFRS